MTNQRINTLFISLDGMTDPLGQSQVLPYLTGLSEKGYSITIVSAEKPANFEKQSKVIWQLTGQNNIRWEPVAYSNKIPVLSSVYNLIKLYRKASKIAKSTNSRIVHCRSYIPALIGLSLKRKLNLKLIFDMRGFWADERLDGAIWSLKNPLHRLMYNFFKRKEKELINNSDSVVTLTNEARREITSWKTTKKNCDITVIPCCADTDHFNFEEIDEVKNNELRKQLNLTGSSFVLLYLGSVGTWYMLDEMLLYYKSLLTKMPKASFLFVTTEPEAFIKSAASRLNIPTDNIIVKRAMRNEVPSYIFLSDASIFFIKPLYSKKGSSPTKMAEILAMGIPVISNKGVGDVDEIISSTNCGVLTEDFSENSFSIATNQILSLRTKPRSFFRAVTLEQFSLNDGQNKYTQIYGKLC